MLLETQQYLSQKVSYFSRDNNLIIKQYMIGNKYNIFLITDNFCAKINRYKKK